MFKRLFWLFVGLLVGAGGSFWFNRRIKQAVARYTPPRLASDATHKARSFGADLLDAAREGRAAMREREQWIRTGVNGDPGGRSGPGA